MTSIIVLDGQTLNPGDLSWKGLEKLGKCEIFPDSTALEVQQRVGNQTAILINKAPVSGEVIRANTDLKYIGVLATGYNTVDLEAASECGIPVCNVPSYGTFSVAQHTIGMLLSLTNGAHLHSEDTRSGGWEARNKWCYTLYPLVELLNKTMGIVGLGRIGQKTAEIAQALGMKVIAHNRTTKNIKDIDEVSIERLFAESDVVSLHCPLTADNQRFVNKSILDLMKPTAYLLNTSRGGLIHEEDLAEALHQGKLAGAGLDVLSSEPPKGGNPLLSAPNAIITPHNAWLSQGARQRLLDTAVSNLAAFLAGKPQNVVNPDFRKSF